MAGSLQALYNCPLSFSDTASGAITASGVILLKQMEQKCDELFNLLSPFTVPLYGKAVNFANNLSPNLFFIVPKHQHEDSRFISPMVWMSLIGGWMPSLLQAGRQD